MGNNKPTRNKRPARVVRTTKQTKKLKVVPKKNAQKNRKKTVKSPNNSLRFISIILFMIVFSYLLKAVYDLINKPNIPSVAVQIGSIDIPLIFDGIIVREETVYTSSIAGVVDFKFNDFDKVKKSALICSVKDEQAVAEVENNLNRLNEDLLNMQNRRMEISIYKKEVEAINEKIKDIMDTKANLLLNKGISSVYEIKDNISQNMNLRNQMLLNEKKGSVENLVDEKEKYEQEYSQNINDIYIEGGGVLSYIVDGKESALTVDELNKLTPEQTRMNISYDNLGYSYSVNINDPVFKIVESNEWYIAAYIPEDYVFDWKENMVKTIYIQQGDEYVPLNMSIYMLDKLDKNMYVVLKATKGLLEFMHTRSIKFKVSNSEHKGYKIPNTSIVSKAYLKIPNYFISEDNTVTKLAGDSTEIISISIREKDDEYSYILQDFNKLRLNDVLQSPNNASNTFVLSSADNVPGVYVINNGYAEFRKVVLNEDIPFTSEYSILNTDQNKNLKLYDRIVSDAKSIEEGQPVF